MNPTSTQASSTGQPHHGLGPPTILTRNLLAKTAPWMKIPQLQPAPAPSPTMGTPPTVGRQMAMTRMLAPPGHTMGQAAPVPGLTIGPGLLGSEDLQHPVAAPMAPPANPSQRQIRHGELHVVPQAHVPHHGHQHPMAAIAPWRRGSALAGSEPALSFELQNAANAVTSVAVARVPLSSCMSLC